ncbi:MAG: SWIM zinc finger family protein [Deltaproteobacteria bacterium]|nr:SWIM zinc finger family protein [Deltaproteobacteria bacterium]
MNERPYIKDTERPAVHPAVVAEATARLPSRLVKRLDKEPALAEAWRWERAGARWTITAEAEAVTLEPGPDGALGALDQVRCSCLLAPRCLHVAAVLACLPLAEAPAPSTSEPASSPAPAPPSHELSPDQRAVAARALAALADALAAGAAALGSVARGALLVALHEARVVGLHRLGRGVAQVVEQARLLREGAPESALGALVGALDEALAVATALTADDAVAPAWVGVARRDFEPLMGKRLYGLFVEPVITATGWAGVVTWLADAEGRLYSVADVMPGPAARAVQVYHGGLGLAGVATSHARVARSGLFVSRARVAEDGRLGGGQDAAVAPASDASDWHAAPLQGLWTSVAPPAAPSDRWVFRDVRVLGPREGALIAEVVGSAIVVELVAASDHRELAFVDNLRVLARARGHTVRGVFQRFPDRPRALAPLAITSPALALEHDGAAQLGFDRLSPASFPPLPLDDLAVLAPPAAARPPPLEALRRRVARVALGGRGTLPEGLAKTIVAEAVALERAFLPTAAALLRDLHAAALVHVRAFTGERRLVRPELFARAWLRARAYLEAVDRQGAVGDSQRA